MLDAVKQLHSLSSLSFLVSSLHHIENGSTLESVEKVARNGVLVNQFKMAGGQVDEILSMVVEDKLSSKESLSGLQVLITHITEDISGIIADFKETREYECV